MILDNEIGILKDSPDKVSLDLTQAENIGKDALESPGNDIFNDLDKLRLTQDFHDLAGVKKVLTTIPVRKPLRQEFIRVRPDDGWSLETAILELKEEHTSYLVAPNLWGELPGEIVPTILYTTLSRQGVLFLWPVRLPGEDGRVNHWHQSALEAAEIAKAQWVRVAANMNLGAYEVFTASADLPNPEWPDNSFQEILKIAFRDQLIVSLDHPVVHRLRGMN
jgi:hypothetical protein